MAATCVKCGLPCDECTRQAPFSEAVSEARAEERKRREDAEAHASALTKALTFYATMHYREHVCDSVSGLTYGLDWNGDMADHPRDVAQAALSSTPASAGDRLRKLEAVAEAAARVLAERVEPDGARRFMDPRSDAKERLSAALSALDAPPATLKEP